MNCRLTSAGVLAASWCLAASGHTAPEHEPTRQLVDLPVNTWHLIDLGGVSSPLGIMAYSSGWYDSEFHQFCIFGGGHFNYSGNEVWCFDIASLAWHEMYPADAIVEPPYTGADQGAYENFDNENYPGAVFNPADETIATARPTSRHTYDALEFIPGVGALLWGGYGWGDDGSPWCVRCKDTWAFDFDSRSWSYLYNKETPAPNVLPGVGASAYNTENGLLYAKVHGETWVFDPSNQRWQQVKTRGSPPWTIEGTLDYDPVHNRLYFFGGNYESHHELWVFDPQRKSWKFIDPSGDGPRGATSSGPGIAYDTRNDVLAIYSSGTIWVFDPTDNTWTTIRPERRPSDDSYVFGRFRFDPINNGFWLHTYEDHQHATWFFRHDL